VLEPAYELCWEGVTLDRAFGPARNAALGTFLATGAITHCVVVASAVLSARARLSRA
jgi:hypothetical protein